MSPGDRTGKVELNELEAHLWEAANILRGLIDQSDFKSYVFPLLLDERRFEELVRDLVIALGAVDAHVVARRHDIGADIEAEFSVGHFATIPVRIQVKYWRDEAGRSPVDQLLNAMADVDFGMVVTTTNFSDDVRQYAAECGEAAGKQLVLVDGDELCRLIVVYGLDALLARRVI